MNTFTPISETDILGLIEDNSPGYCVYFLFHNHKIVYIGKTNNIQNRIYQHKMESIKTFTDFRCIRFPSDEEAIINEVEYIKHYLPKYNIANNRLNTKILKSIRVSDEVLYFIKTLSEKDNLHRPMS